MTQRAVLNTLRKCDEDAPGCIVALSGGKDSVATLSLCQKAFKDVAAFYMYLVPGMRCIEDPIERICVKLDVPLAKVPHWHLAEILKKGVYSPDVKATHIRKLKQKHIESYLRTHIGHSWVAYGHRMSDSVSRRYYLRKRGIVDEDKMRLAPIYNWKTSEVIRYLELNGLLYDMPTFGDDKARGHGFTLKEASINWLRDNYPEDYEKVREFFPTIDALQWKGKFGNI